MHHRVRWNTALIQSCCNSPHRSPVSCTRSSSVANPHAQTEPSNLRRSIPSGATASAIKRRRFRDLLRKPQNHSSFRAPFKTIKSAANERVDRNYITAALKLKQVSIVGVGSEGSGFPTLKARQTDDQAATNLAQTEYRYGPQCPKMGPKASLPTTSAIGRSFSPQSD